MRLLTRAIILFVIIVYLAIGVSVFMTNETKPCESDAALAAFDDADGGDCAEPLTFIDALYMSIITISTVGYGDFTPSSSGMRIFTVIYVLFGTSFTFYHLSGAVGKALDAWQTLCLSIVDMFDKTTKVLKVDSTGDGKADKEISISGRSKGLSGKEFDLNGDGQADFVAPPGAVTFYVQELFPAFLLMAIFQLVSAAIFVPLVPGLDFGTAFYHCMITATTVGYGDVSLTTQGARIFAAVHAIISVSWLAQLLGAVTDLRAVRKQQLARAELLIRPLDVERITGLDSNGDGVDQVWLEG